MELRGEEWDLDNIRKYLTNKYYANLKAGRNDSALAVATRLCEAIDTAVIEWERNNASNELVNIYDTQQKETELAEKDAQLSEQGFWAVAAALILLTVFFIVYAVYRRMAAKRLSIANKQLERRNQQLIVANARAEESARMKADFIQQISHEIRTPLNILSGFAQIITSPEMTLEENEKTDINNGIIENTNRITGLVNKKQPWNETRSGEFLLMLPAVGGFQDGNMICSYAIRYNSGDLIHEVPHSTTSGYSTYEPKLGEKASHGCIRVQRRRTPSGVNMEWIWENRKSNVKIVIWEDWQGRQIPYPEDDSAVYYNPKGGEYYHSAETCYCAKGKTFTAFTYGELDSEPYSKLRRCSWCTPPLRKREIDEINAVYAAGGDHDPILTEAREALE